MEVLIHLAFTLLKVALLAWLYAAVVLRVVQFFGRFRPDAPLVRASRDAPRFRRVSRRCIAGALLGFSCTYWGNHGLGDSSRIPLGHGEAMLELNGTMAYFEPTVPIAWQADNPEVTAYQVRHDVLCAALGPDPAYFTYDLVSKRSQVFDTPADYQRYARSAGLPAPAELEPFAEQYSRYWNGWRFWLLP